MMETTTRPPLTHTSSLLNEQTIQTKRIRSELDILCRMLLNQEATIVKIVSVEDNGYYVYFSYKYCSGCICNIPSITKCKENWGVVVLTPKTASEENDGFHTISKLNNVKFFPRILKWFPERVRRYKRTLENEEKSQAEKQRSYEEQEKERKRLRQEHDEKVQRNIQQRLQHEHQLQVEYERRQLERELEIQKRYGTEEYRGAHALLCLLSSSPIYS
jgi:hypothetical protein